MSDINNIPGTKLFTEAPDGYVVHFVYDSVIALCPEAPPLYLEKCGEWKELQLGVDCPGIPVVENRTVYSGAGGQAFKMRRTKDE
jgi:hypothetical protein